MANESGMNESQGYKSHLKVGKNMTAKRTWDLGGSRTFSVLAEGVAFAVGAAGTTGKIGLIHAPVYNSIGTNIGSTTDTSFAWVTGTILTTEVAYRSDLTDAQQYALMSNGDYAINYDMGEIRYKKATAGVADTCNYVVRRNDVEVDELDIEIGAVEIKDSTANTRASVIAANSAAVAYWLGSMPARYMATPPALTDTFASPLLLDSVGKLKNVGDGYYVVGTNAVPNTTGLIVNSAAAAPDYTTQTVRLTGGSNAADGLVALNIWGLDTRSLDYGFNGTTWDRQWAFTHDQDLSAVSERWKGIGGWDETANKFAALPIVSDNAASPNASQGLLFFGEYNSTLPTYNDGDAAVLQLDDRGRLITAVELNDYVDDSNEFTIASSKMLAIGGVATTDAVDAGDVGAFKMDIYRQLATGIWDSTGAYRAEVLAAGADTVANTTDSLVTSTWNYSFNGSSWDRIRDATALADATLAGTLGSYHNAETGVPISLIMGYDSTAGANAYRAVAVSALGAFAIDTNGFYTAVTNPVPDTEGLVVCQNAAAPAITDYVVRPTGGVSTASITSANFFGIDTRSKVYGRLIAPGTTDVEVNAITLNQTSTNIDGHNALVVAAELHARIDDNYSTAVSMVANTGAGQGTNLLSAAGEIVDFDTSAGNDYTGATGVLGASAAGAKPLLVTQQGSPVIDGFYTVGLNPLPSGIGVLACQNAAAPALTDQTLRITGGTAAGLVSGVAIANYSGLDVRSLCGGINAAKVYPFDACAVSAGVTYGLSVGVFDASGNRMPAGDAASRPIFVQEVGAPGSEATFLQNQFVLALVSYTVNTAAWGAWTTSATSVEIQNASTAGQVLYIHWNGAAAATATDWQLQPGESIRKEGAFVAATGFSLLGSATGAIVNVTVNY